MFIFISRQFKCPKSSPVVCLICYCLRSVRQLFLYCENAFKNFTYSSVFNINYARSEILVSCLVYIDQLLFLNKLLIFFNKAYYRESYTVIPIIEHSSVVTVAKWLDRSLKVNVDFRKPSSGSIPENPKLCISRFLAKNS